MYHFASDNTSTVHPQVMQALAAVNSGHALAYGEDDLSVQVVKEICAATGAGEAYFTLNGTGTNIVLLHALTQPYGGVVLSNESHVVVHESGALQRQCLPVEHTNGKITVEGIRQYLNWQGMYHQPLPQAISIAQTTELGHVYSLQEVRDICEFAHEHDMTVHMDGARISNACAALGVGLREATFDLGIDALSFGMVKNGLMFGEVACLATPLAYGDNLRKHHLQLQSKMRYIAAQYQAVLQDDLWLTSAQHANALAASLNAQLSTIEAVTVHPYGGTNMVFCEFPRELVTRLQAIREFYVEDLELNVARLVCAHDNTQAHVDDFVSQLRAMLSA